MPGEVFIANFDPGNHSIDKVNPLLKLKYLIAKFSKPSNPFKF